MRDLKIIVGENVKKYRKESGLTQCALATIVGWCGTAQPISLIESGKKNIQLETLDKIAEALSVTVVDLVEDWGE